DTLTGISRKTGAGISRLKELNGLDARSVLRVGQVLVMSPAKSTATAVASRAGAKTTQLASGSGGSGPGTQVASTSGAGAAHKVVHRVRKGDTVGAIARRYGTDVKSVQKWNPFLATLIHPGQRLTIFTTE
ncbi:MAG: LysM peptidoglycan-binding domain-containing protein, partial [Acidobacteria bacterium]|nr:LysM peptidoglycan-binding domain-containing protein [Acidobacteriota bacterium]